MPDYADICPDTEEGMHTDEYGCSNNQNLIRIEDTENIEDDQTSDSSGKSSGLSGSQVMRVALGIIALLAGAFLLTLVVQLRGRD
jgi:hypothetical protein